MVGKWWLLRGCVLFRAYLERDDALGQRELAAKLGTTAGTIYFWKVGFRRPGPEFRDALLRLCGIPLNAWKTPAERRTEKRLRAA